jgi:hypothetical protein
MYNCAIAMAREYVGILTSEEVLVDLLAVGLGDEHLDGLRKTREC